jgi:hypothetical protein
METETIDPHAACNQADTPNRPVTGNHALRRVLHAASFQHANPPLMDTI